MALSLMHNCSGCNRLYDSNIQCDSCHRTDNHFCMSCHNSGNKFTHRYKRSINVAICYITFAFVCVGVFMY